MSTQRKETQRDGTVKLVDTTDRPPANPSLVELNRASRQADEAYRAEMGEAAEIAKVAVMNAFGARSGKRMQKPLRALA